MKLLHDYVLVKPDEMETKTESGLILTVADSVPDTGVVVEVGEGTFDHGKWVHVDLQKGDYIKYTSGSTIKIAGKQYTLLKYKDVICVLE